MSMMLTVAAAAEDISAVQFFVSSDGSDTNPGTQNEPFATIQRAQGAIRELKKTSGLPEGGVTVYIRGGEYNVKPNTVEFTKEDSGEEGSPIVYKAYGDEKPIISAGVKIPGNKFQKVTDQSVLDRFNTAKAKKNIVCVDLNDYLTKEEIEAKYRTVYDAENTMEAWKQTGDGNQNALGGVAVYVDDYAYIPARWPNKDDDGFCGSTEMGDIVAKENFTDPNAAFEFGYTDDRIEKWGENKQAAVVNLNGGWFLDTYRLSGINKDKKTISLSADSAAFSANQKGGNYYYINILDELDVPGEYYVDTDTGMLYMYPTGNLKGKSVGIGYAGSFWFDSIINFDRASYITLSGITAELIRTNGINVIGGKEINIINCDVRNVGFTGINMCTRDGMPQNQCGTSSKTYRGGGWNYYGADFINSQCSEEDYKEYGGFNHSIIGTTVKNCGTNGMYVAGGNRLTLERCEILVEDCEIENTNLVHMSPAAGMLVLGVGLTIRNNSIHNMPGPAVRFGTNDSIFEYNEFYDCVREAFDMGVMYTNNFGACVSVGTEIRYNYFHDIKRELPEKGAFKDGLGIGDGKKGYNWKFAVYGDSATSQLEYHHNVFANMPFGVFPCSVENNLDSNLYINVDKPIWIKDQDIVRSFYARDGESLETLKTVDGFYDYWDFLDNEAWRTKYPWLADIAKELEKRVSEAWLPATKVKGNYCVFWDNKERFNDTISIYDLKYCNIENNTFTNYDPGFTDIDNGDYTFSKDSAIVKANPELAKIDIAKMRYSVSVLKQYATEDFIELELNRAADEIPKVTVTDRFDNTEISAEVTLENCGKRIRISPQSGKFNLSHSYFVKAVLKGKVLFDKAVVFEMLFQDDFEGYGTNDELHTSWNYFNKLENNESNRMEATDETVSLYTEGTNTVMKLTAAKSDWFLVNKNAEENALKYDSYILSYEVTNGRSGQLQTVINQPHKFTGYCGTVRWGTWIPWEGAAELPSTGITKTGVNQIIWANEALAELQNEKIRITEISERNAPSVNDVLRFYYNGSFKYEIPENEDFKYAGDYGAFGFASGNGAVYLDNIKAYKAVWSATKNQDFDVSDYTLTARKMNITFDGYVDEASAKRNIKLMQNNTAVNTVININHDGKTVEISPSDDLVDGVVYTLSASGVTDRYGNEAPAFFRSFVIDYLWNDDFSKYTSTKQLDEKYKLLEVQTDNAQQKKPSDDDSGVSIQDGMLNITSDMGRFAFTPSIGYPKRSEWDDSYIFEIDTVRASEKDNLQIYDYAIWNEKGESGGVMAGRYLHLYFWERAAGISQECYVNNLTWNVRGDLYDETGADSAERSLLFRIDNKILSIYNNGKLFFRDNSKPVSVDASDFAIRASQTATYSGGTPYDTEYNIKRILAYKVHEVSLENKILYASAFKDAAGVYGEVCVNNTQSGDLTNFSLITGAYDRGGRLLALSEMDIDNAKAGQKNYYNYSIATDSDIYTLKCFMWDKTSCMKPLAESCETKIMK